MSDGSEAGEDPADGERGARERAERALASHGAFERAEQGEGAGQSGGDRDGDERDGDDRADGTFATGTVATDARVRVEEVGSGARYRVTVRVPTIDAVVAGETVAPVVQEGWFETFERRLEDVGGATRADPEPPTAELDEAAGEVIVRTAIESERPASAAEDAKAIVDYVEGTFVEGLIPGYTYREPASALLERARSSGQQ